jgi:hypothetical protein
MRVRRALHAVARLCLLCWLRRDLRLRLLHSPDEVGLFDAVGEGDAIGREELLHLMHAVQ